MNSALSPLFVDTGALYAIYDEDDEHHGEAENLVEQLQTGELPYGPIFTSRYVLSEMATLILYKVGHSEAVAALENVRTSSTFNILPVSAGIFDAACTEFDRYDDQNISMVDHLSAVLAEDHDVEHIFAFDSDFRTLGFSLVPDDIPKP